MTTKPLSTGRKLYLARTRMGWTQRETARRAKVTPVHLCRIERGKAMPSLSLLERLAKLFKTTSGKLL